MWGVKVWAIDFMLRLFPNQLRSVVVSETFDQIGVVGVKQQWIEFQDRARAFKIVEGKRFTRTAERGSYCNKDKS